MCLYVIELRSNDQVVLRQLLGPLHLFRLPNVLRKFKCPVPGTYLMLFTLLFRSIFVPLFVLETHAFSKDLHVFELLPLFGPLEISVGT